MALSLFPCVAIPVTVKSSPKLMRRYCLRSFTAADQAPPKFSLPRCALSFSDKIEDANILSSGMVPSAIPNAAWQSKEKKSKSE